MKELFAKIIIDQDAKALDKVFEYKVPEDLNVSVGERVIVPFGARQLQGFIVELCENSEYDPSKIKEITRKIEDFAVIKPEMLALMFYMADKLHLKLASILRLFLPSEMRTDKIKELIVRYVQLADGFVLPSKRATKQLEIICHLQENGKQKFADVSNEFGYAPLSALIKNGTVEVIEEQFNRIPAFDEIITERRQLTDLQQRAVDSVQDEKTYLLHGVTGSGKTEVYSQSPIASSCPQKRATTTTSTMRHTFATIATGMPPPKTPPKTTT